MGDKKKKLPKGVSTLAEAAKRRGPGGSILAGARHTAEETAVFTRRGSKAFEAAGSSKKGVDFDVIDRLNDQRRKTKTDLAKKIGGKLGRGLKVFNIPLPSQVQEYRKMGGPTFKTIRKKGRLPSPGSI